MNLKLYFIIFIPILILLCSSCTFEHNHEFIEGKCECGENDPEYTKPHEHQFIEGKCECGENDPEYIEIKYTITFVDYDDTIIKTIIINKGENVSYPNDPVREGYVFAGWYKDPDFKTKWDFYKDKTDKTITIYAKWKANEGTVNYDIIIEDMVGGKLEVNPKKASLGEPVVITVIPDEGKRLVQGSVRINGEPTDFLSFVMPKGKVTLSAEFENIPENEGNNEKSKLPLFIIIGVVFIILIVIVVIIAKKRNDFNADLDPEEDLTVEDDNDDNWIDETIVVEDGFKEGKKVVENTEPDYGAPDLIEEDLD